MTESSVRGLLGDHRPGAERKVDDWIDSFVEHHAYLGSPKIWLKWSAYSALSAALERKVHIVLRGRKLFLNLFTFLVGPPGTGKTTAIWAAREILVRVSSVKLAPDKVTPEKFINILSHSSSVELKNGEVSQHVSVAILSNELGVFVRPGDRDFPPILTDLYDCPATYSYSTISRGDDRFENLYINLLGGVTPKSLASIIGPDGLGKGFTARVFFIFAESLIPTDPFDTPRVGNVEPLVHDLELINMLTGHFSFTMDAMAYIREWLADNMAPIPADPRFEEYGPRRLTHWIKLSALRAAARRQDKIIQVADCESAKKDLLEAERYMPAAFEAFGANPLNDAAQGAAKWVMIQRAITKAPISETALRTYLMRSGVSLQYLDVVIEAMVFGGLIMEFGGKRPNRNFEPRVH